MSRETTWRNLCAQADPDFNRNSRNVKEYEFTSPWRGDTRTHEAGSRVFFGDYALRGPYEPQAPDDGSYFGGDYFPSRYFGALYFG